jgi:hypothetical protein
MRGRQQETPAGTATLFPSDRHAILHPMEFIAVPIARLSRLVE